MKLCEAAIDALATKARFVRTADIEGVFMRQSRCKCSECPERAHTYRLRPIFLLSHKRRSFMFIQMNKKHPKLDLDRLREIGWSLWDPIGLDGNTGIWREETFADEYDTYLIKAAGMLRNQCTLAEVVEYLFFIETEYMGLGVGTNESELRKRLLKVAQTINDDPMIRRDGNSADPTL